MHPIVVYVIGLLVLAALSVTSAIVFGLYIRSSQKGCQTPAKYAKAIVGLNTFTFLASLGGAFAVVYFGRKAGSSWD